MSTLLRAAFSVTRTKRRRFLWCAWWSRIPSDAPFRPPDAWSGGAKTEAEARLAAEAAAGLPLEEIEGRWAGAWVRVRAGLPAFPTPRVNPVKAVDAAVSATSPRPVDPHELLDVPPGAPLAALKAAFREKALLAHPDHGGDAATFIALKRAYDVLVKRRQRGR